MKLKIKSVRSILALLLLLSKSISFDSDISQSTSPETIYPENILDDLYLTPNNTSHIKLVVMESSGLLNESSERSESDRIPLNVPLKSCIPYSVKENFFTAYGSLTSLSLIVPGALIFCFDTADEMSLVYSLYVSAALANLHTYGQFLRPISYPTLTRYLLTITTLTLTATTIGAWIHWCDGSPPLALSCFFHFMNAFFMACIVKLESNDSPPKHIIFPESKRNTPFDGEDIEIKTDYLNETPTDLQEPQQL